MTTATEPASQRLAYLRRFDPLLSDFVRRGILSEGDADLVLIAAHAVERGEGVRFAVPGRSSELAGCIAFDLAVRRLLDADRYGGKPIALVTSAPWRNLHALAEVAGEVLTKGLGAARLRSDGRVQDLHGARTRPLAAVDHLVFVTPRAGWPGIEVGLGTAVLDATALGSALDDALDWAQENAPAVQVVASLDPASEPAGVEIDWPVLRAEPGRWGRPGAWPTAGVVHIEDAGVAPAGLEAARREISAMAKSDRPWPPQLRAALALSRALSTVAVPLSLYDAHTAKTIAPSFAERIELLESVRPGDLEAPWRSFAETSWPGVKRQLLDVASSLDAHNPKAVAIGLAAERLLSAGHTLTIWANSLVHAKAIETHLLTSGFAVRAEDFAAGRIATAVLGARYHSAKAASASLLTGLPTSWQLPAAVSDTISGPLVLLAYDFEVVRIPAYLRWLLNANRLQRHDERSRVLARALGRGVVCGAPPPPIECTFEHHGHGEVTITGALELGQDSAEFAALADDEWLALAVQQRERTGSDHDGSMRPALAFLADPGPGVLLVAEHALVDRFVAGRLRPMPATELVPGMTILGGAPGGTTVFDRVRPHLDRLQGAGARFWLDRWDDALLSALRRCGGRSGLTTALVEVGASITAAAVGAWPSPYRIGPRDEDNVRRVAEIAHDAVVAHHARRIHAVMHGARLEHQKLGRRLATAVRRHLAGDADAFDPIEELLGVAIEELLGAVSVVTIRQFLGNGRAPVSSLGLVHPPATAQRYFLPGART